MGALHTGVAGRRAMVLVNMDLCPVWSPCLGFAGAATALIMSCAGSAYGTGKAALGISTIGVAKPEIVMKNIIPIVMAGVLGIYGLIIAVIIGNDVQAVSSKKDGHLLGLHWFCALGRWLVLRIQ